MKLTAISLYSNGAEVALLSFKDPSSVNSYQVKGIDGLDTDEITPKFYQNGGSGDKFYELSMEKRTIVLKIDLNVNYSIGETASELRDNLYAAIASSRTGLVQLKFLNGVSIMASISGFIRKIEAPHFDKTMQVQITIDCIGSMLLAPDATDVTIPPGELTFTVTDNISTAPHGLSFYLQFTAPASSFVIGTPSWSFTITPGTISGDTGFLTGDQLYFVNEYSGKQLFIIRGSDTIHLADKIIPGSVWPVLFRGDNTFVVSTIDINWLSFTHYHTYWGV